MDLPMPAPISAPTVKWLVLTPENFEATMAELKKSGRPLVLFAVTPEGYEELSMTMTELRNFILSQRTIILQYKDYYEKK